MASDNRQFTDFAKFPGSIDEETGYWATPTLYKIDDKSRLRSWRAEVRLIKDNQKRLRGVNWNQMKEHQIPINTDYYGTEDELTELPSKVIAQFWSVTGLVDGKQTVSDPTYVTKGANIGRSNERHAFHQALIKVRNLFECKKRIGFGLDPSGVSEHKMSGNNKFMLPMLAKTWKNGAKHIVYPCAVQPKLDGTRGLSWIPEETSEVSDSVIQSRKKKVYPDMEDLQNVIHPILTAYYDDSDDQSIYLDGELYSHGKKLQDISGKVRKGKSKKKTPKKPPSRNKKSSGKKKSSPSSDKSTEEKKSNTDDFQLEYWLYDCFYPLELDTDFKSRYEQLKTIFEEEVDPYPKRKAILKLVPIKIAKTPEEVWNIADEFIDQGYEGAIVRNWGGVYKASTSRGNDLVKVKVVKDAEYKVVGFTQGSTGKDREALIWICETKSGVQFNVTPKGMTNQERYDAYKECQEKFDSLYAGRMLKVEYMELSKDKVPQHAKAVEFRDYE